MDQPVSAQAHIAENSTRERMAALDGIRGLAATAVAVHHISEGAGYVPEFMKLFGQLGVLVFFVLSGFLMGRLYTYSRPTPQSVALFWIKRAAKVLPLFFMCVAISYAHLYWFQSTRPFYAVTWDMLWSHILLWQAQSVLWTIPVEFQFYILFPIVWIAFSKIGNGMALILLAVLSILAIGRFFPTIPQLAFIQIFIIGLLASRTQIILTPRAADATFFILTTILVLCLPGILDMFGLVRTYLPFWSSPIYLSLIPAVILASISSPVANLIIGSPPLVFLGNISYSAYLLHSFAFWTLYMYTPLPKMGWFITVCVGMAASLIVATACYYYIETPTRKAIERAGRRMLAKVPADTRA